MASRALVVLIALMPAASFAQDPAVAGARASIVEKRMGAVSVTVTNRRDSALVAWEIGLFRPGAPRPEYVSGSDFTGSIVSFSADSGPVHAGASRTIRLSTFEESGYSAAVTFALFADGHYEGEPRATEAFLEKRTKEADDLRYWLGALSGIPAESDDDVRRGLRERVAKAADAGRLRDSTLGANLRNLATEEFQRPVGGVLRTFKHYLESARARLASLERPVAVEPERAQVVSVAVRATAVTNVLTTARVQNLRDVPLEVVKVVEFENGRRSGGMMTDLCCQAEARSESGPIQPGETREFLSGSVREKEAVRHAELEFVMYADLTWEGPRSLRNEVLKTRELRAADAAFWAGVLTDAGLMPVEQGIAYLQTKTRERAGVWALSPVPGFQSDVDEVVRQARRNPASFATAARTCAWRLETYRIQATRHQSLLDARAKARH
jgi:hypothetical protein